MPERYQRQRIKDWTKPPGSVIVDRTSRWGNPYVVGKIHNRLLLSVYVSDRAHAVRLYREHLRSSPELVAAIRRELAGKDLGCPCPLDGQPCHADVMIAVAAGGEP